MALDKAVFKVVVGSRFDSEEVESAWVASITEVLGGAGQVVVSADESELLGNAADADIWLAGHLSPRIVEVARKLRWVHRFGAGVEGLLFSELVDSPIVVTNGRGAHAEAMSEFALLAMLAWVRRWPELFRGREQRQWVKLVPDEIRGKVLGLLGYGAIGQAVARQARALGVNTIACRRNVRRQENSGDTGVSRTYGPEDLHSFLGACDFVLNSLPLTSETTGLLGEAEFKAMRFDAVLINVGRGKTVQEAALIRALQERWIAGAVLDVFAEEPLPETAPFWTMDNVIVTCHSSGRSPQNTHRSRDAFCDNLRRFVAGKPLNNIVDKRLGY